jgi:hypothetical protein
MISELEDPNPKLQHPNGIVILSEAKDLWHCFQFTT